MLRRRLPEPLVDRREIAALLFKVNDIAATLEGADKPGIEANRVWLHVPDGGRALPVLLTGLTKAGIDAIGVDVNRPTLDDVFLTLTGKSLRD